MSAASSADGRQADFELLKSAVARAGALALKYFESDFKAWEKGRNDPVTEADLAVDRLLEEALREARPDYGWLSEESADDPARLACRRVWMVDPIDGTRAFVNRRPEFAVSAALVEDGHPVLGVVFNPVTDAFFAARLGGGAFLGDKRLAITPRAELEGARMLGYRHFFSSEKYWPVPWPRMNYAQVNSIALRMALVAAGSHDIVVSVRPKSDWDIAAADLIVTEAGGAAADSDGTAFVYNRKKPVHRNVIACSRPLVAPVLARVRPALDQWRAQEKRKRSEK